MFFLKDCKICTSALNFEQFNDNFIFGELTSLSVKRLSQFSNVYLHFQNKHKFNQTLIVCVQNEIYVDEIQVC